MDKLQKFQAPNIKQCLNSKFKIVFSPEFNSGLVIGIWDLFGFLDLGFGILFVIRHSGFVIVSLSLRIILL